MAIGTANAGGNRLGLFRVEPAFIGDQRRRRDVAVQAQQSHRQVHGIQQLAQVRRLRFIVRQHQQAKQLSQQGFVLRQAIAVNAFDTGLAGLHRAQDIVRRRRRIQHQQAEGQCLQRVVWRPANRRL